MEKSFGSHATIWIEAQNAEKCEDAFVVFAISSLYNSRDQSTARQWGAGSVFLRNK